MPYEFTTFFLAITGYGLLTGNALFAGMHRRHRGIMVITAIIIAVHVLMVWQFRYEWQLLQATRNGYAGFLIFHAALGMILASPFLPMKWFRRAVVTAFLLVSMGAIGATLRYGEVFMYFIPVVIFALSGSGGLMWMHMKQRRIPQST